MKFKIINTMGSEFDIDLEVVPRLGELIDGNEILSVNYLINSDYVAEVRIKTIHREG